MSWHIAQSSTFAQPTLWRPFVVVSTVWLQFGNFLNSNWSSLLIPIHREDYIILHHTTCNGTAPIFCTCTQRLWQCCVRAFGPFCSTQQCQSHPALSPLLICCPIPSVIQQLHHRLPGSLEPGPWVAQFSIKDTDVKTHWEIGWTFLLHQPIQRHQQKRRQETNVFGK